MTKKIRTPIFALILLLLVSVSYAQTAEYEEIKYTIMDDNLVISNYVRFQNMININETALEFPDNAKSLSIMFDNTNIGLDDYYVYVNSSSLFFKELTTEYVIPLTLNNGDIINYAIPAYDSKIYMIKVFLSDDMKLLSNPKTGIRESIFPSPSQITSDGISIIIIWEYKDIKKNDGKAFFIKTASIEDSRNVMIYVSIIFFILLATIGYLIFYSYSKKNKNEIKDDKIAKEKKITTEKKQNKASNEQKNHNFILEHLKEDEKQVIEILKTKNGECEQGTIRFLGNFSKATLSRILMELEARKIIYKEQKGKKNIIRLK